MRGKTLREMIKGAVREELSNYIGAMVREEIHYGSVMEKAFTKSVEKNAPVSMTVSIDEKVDVGTPLKMEPATGGIVTDPSVMICDDHSDSLPATDALKILNSREEPVVNVNPGTGLTANECTTAKFNAAQISRAAGITPLPMPTPTVMQVNYDGDMPTPATTPLPMPTPPVNNAIPYQEIVAAAAKPAPTIELDTDNIPWDSRIHSSSKAKVADGTWRRRRGIDDNTYSTVMTELKGAPPVAATLATPGAMTLPQLMSVVSKIPNYDWSPLINKAKELGYDNLPLCADKPEVVAELVKVANVS